MSRSDLSQRVEEPLSRREYAEAVARSVSPRDSEKRDLLARLLDRGAIPRLPSGWS